VSKIKSAVSWARDNPQYHNYDPCVHVPMFIILVQAVQCDALEAVLAAYAAEYPDEYEVMDGYKAILKLKEGL